MWKDLLLDMALLQQMVKAGHILVGILIQVLFDAGHALIISSLTCFFLRGLSFLRLCLQSKCIVSIVQMFIRRAHTHNQYTRKYMHIYVAVWIRITFLVLLGDNYPHWAIVFGKKNCPTVFVRQSMTDCKQLFLRSTSNASGHGTH